MKTDNVIGLEIAYAMRVARVEQQLDDAEFICAEKYNEYLKAKDEMIRVRAELKRLSEWQIPK